MNKMAYVSVTYLYSFEPKDLGLNPDCSKEEFYKAVESRMKDEEADMPRSFDDIEIFIEGVK